ncbi:DUF3408 domain-containing protein [Capnocytophaga canimorsus]|uniref:Conjugal transfer protein TraB n=2 Tax=Capnocytophaga canimorsus TaxID=28188 RepID=F9YPP1_CAPCC|nr:DUF3408 domain-containing protein [Capnocytophaga canimorsus]AEK23387.1 Conserved hypothetical protein [Capnocytophaga canimorsus Cc5]ATA91053.1 DUF3408 domain-containing protein [Capnocytophaga canimorsus]CEN47471.1 conserved hypothetical protein [Capnocytophaga canimorsus]VEJ18477.1 Protein of uncharacterised function (DUF3408) [Capnocytophaga canimorsus]
MDADAFSKTQEKNPQTTNEKTAFKKESPRKTKSDSHLYETLFFQQGDTSARDGKSVYIRSEYHQRIARIVQVIGEDKISIYTYLDNVLKAHFEQYKQEITESFQEKYKPIF